MCCHTSPRTTPTFQTHFLFICTVDLFFDSVPIDPSFSPFPSIISGFGGRRRFISCLQARNDTNHWIQDLDALVNPRIRVIFHLSAITLLPPGPSFLAYLTFPATSFLYLPLLSVQHSLSLFSLVLLHTTFPALCCPITIALLLRSLCHYDRLSLGLTDSHSRLSVFYNCFNT
ncbi:hypothetical protein BC629DRAFT_1570800 [Irpex lacteus]|nr:hypothetical protein BC629DRAFT_1570800 [Irpex lacteus]